MVVQDNKIGRICIYVDLHNLNDACVHDPFPTPFANEILENVGGREVFYFMDGFSSYHQEKIAEKDRHKKTFAQEWGLFSYIVKPSGLKNEPTIVSRMVVTSFKNFMKKFLEVHLDDWTMFNSLKKNI